jgi:hypothetical protein
VRIMLIAAATIPYIRRIDTDTSEDERRGHHQGAVQPSTGLLSFAECLLLPITNCLRRAMLAQVCCVLQRASSAYSVHSTVLLLYKYVSISVCCRACRRS